MYFNELMLKIEIERLKAEVMIRNQELNFLRGASCELISCLEEEDGGSRVIKVITSTPEMQRRFDKVLGELCAYNQNLSGETE